MGADGVGAILSFFQLLYGDSPSGHLNLWTTPTKASSFFPVAKLDEAARAAAEIDSRKHNVYFGTALRELVPDSGRGGQTDVFCLPGFWLDVDIRGAHHADPDLPASIDEAARVIDGFAFDPTLAVDSGYGLHLWWLFDKPYIWERPKFERPRRLSKRFQETLRGLFHERHYACDDTSDLARVLRPPGTHNWKGQEGRLVSLLFSDGPRHSWEEIEKTLVHPVGRPKREYGPDGVPLDFNPEGFDDQLNEVRRNLAVLPKNKRILQKVLSGEAFAKIGARDSALQQVASQIAFVAPDISPRVLVEILRPSLEAMAKEHDDPRNPCPTIDDAVDKIVRAQSDKQAQLAGEAEVKNRLIRSARRTAAKKVQLWRDVEANGGGNGGNGAGGHPPPGGEGENDGEEERHGPYTEEEISRFAASQDCSVTDFERRWIIQHGTAFWVFVNGVYKKPVRDVELLTVVQTDLSPAPVRLMALKPDGTERRRSVQDLMSEHGTVARSVVSDLSLQTSYYDAETETFHEAVTPLRRIEPLYDPDIEKWLMLLGGEHQDKLFDWLATVSLVSDPTCALYLSGPPGTGKSFLAQSLGRLWTEEGVTELEKVIGGFNQDLSRCPVVVAEETIPRRQMGNTTSFLRELIATRTRTLSRKFMNNTTLSGCIRLVLTANNEEILGEHADDLTVLDMEAVAERVLHIPTQREAAVFLAGLPRGTTQRWHEEDRIPAFIHYLRTTREVEIGSRYLVAGLMSQVHRQMVLHGNITSLVCEWLVRYLDKPFTSVKKEQLIRVYRGQLLVATQAIVTHWEHFISSTLKPPSTHKIGKALKSISVGEPKQIKTHKGRLVYHVINREYVYEWAVQNQIGDRDKMDETVHELELENMN